MAFKRSPVRPRLSPPLKTQSNPKRFGWVFMLRLLGIYVTILPLTTMFKCGMKKDKFLTVFAVFDDITQRRLTTLQDEVISLGENFPPRE